jgi:hypothetical protein
MPKKSIKKELKSLANDLVSHGLEQGFYQVHKNGKIHFFGAFYRDADFECKSGDKIKPLCEVVTIDKVGDALKAIADTERENTDKGMNCECGFKFSGPGDIRNCGAFITEKGHSGIICPECGKRYVKINGDWCVFEG